MKTQYLELYRQAHDNAKELLNEARILFENHCYARAYFLAYSALEEISKSQFAADVFTGFCTEEDFLAFYTNHKSKIERMEWAHNDASSYPHNMIWLGPDIDDVEKIAPSQPLWSKRQNSLYVGYENNIVKVPQREITKNDAEEIIHIVSVAFARIWEVSGEFGGHQIGTKGFMK